MRSSPRPRMRVEGGSARGIELKAPSSRRVRPITSLARQAIFSILENSGHEYGIVLDLFAGSGALGIEALSRGVQRADFVDSSRECCTIIKQNLSRTGFSERGHVYCMAATRAKDVLDLVYDVIFMDPPYDDTTTGSLLAAIERSPLLGEDGLVVVSHGNRHPISDAYGSLFAFKKRRYGDAHIYVYHREEH